MIPGQYPTTLNADGMVRTPVAKQSFIKMMAALTLGSSISAN
jgi:hypothetical protein